MAMAETAAPASKTDFREIFFGEFILSAMCMDYPHPRELETVAGPRSAREVRMRR
jgi:hypothetical protein